MRRGIPFLLLLAVPSGCNVPNASRDEKRGSSQEDLSKVPTDELTRRLAGTTGDPRIGRYQMIAAKANTFKFDTATGRTGFSTRSLHHGRDCRTLHASTPAWKPEYGLLSNGLLRL